MRLILGQFRRDQNQAQRSQRQWGAGFETCQVANTHRKTERWLIQGHSSADREHSRPPFQFPDIFQIGLLEYRCCLVGRITTLDRVHPTPAYLRVQKPFRHGHYQAGHWGQIAAIVADAKHSARLQDSSNLVQHDRGRLPVVEALVRNHGIDRVLREIMETAGVSLAKQYAPL